jgi:hypothetical protein
MKHKFLLHIGRQKTGTTTLQHFLANNFDVLHDKYNVNYPVNLEKHPRVAHHFLAVFYDPRLRGAMTSDEIANLENDVKELIENINQSKDKQILISSERFQNINPKNIVEFFTPGDTKIIVYIREQAEFLASAYAQVVQKSQTTETLEEFAMVRNIDLYTFLSKWTNVFGKENIAARVYDRKKLLNKSIIDDFIKTAEIADTTQDFTFIPPDRNPSIGGNLLEFKKAVNKIYNSKNIIGKLAMPFGMCVQDNPQFNCKPFISMEQITKIREKYSASNERLLREFFPDQNELFEYSDFSSSMPSPEVTEKEIALILDYFKANYPEIYSVIADEFPHI